MGSEEELTGASSLRCHTLAGAGEVGPADGGRRRSSERARRLLAALLLVLVAAAGCLLPLLLVLVAAACCSASYPILVPQSVLKLLWSMLYCTL